MSTYAQRVTISLLALAGLAFVLACGGSAEALEVTYYYLPG